MGRKHCFRLVALLSITVAMFGAWAAGAAGQPVQTEGEYTVWRKDIDSGCLDVDHDYPLDITADPAEMTDISYSMTNFDVDYVNTQECDGGPEVDIMYFNGNPLGQLHGATNSWSSNSWPLEASQLVQGSNDIHIDTDSTNTGCWCVGVGSTMKERRPRVDQA